jgi:hypothetical protein
MARSAGCNSCMEMHGEPVRATYAPRSPSFEIWHVVC